MPFYTVAVATLAHSKNASFTYHSDLDLSPGSLVRVPIGRTIANGVVLSKTLKKPSFATKPITSVLHEGFVLPRQLIALAEWLSKYYVSHLGIVLQSILPSGLHKQRRDIARTSQLPMRAKKTVVLTADQQAAIDSITSSEASAFLLHGVPGSGKTQVYIESSKQYISQGKSVIVLVPEIALTAQLIAEFSNHFPHVVVIHSAMTEAERHLTWQRMLTATSPLIVVGPRSALFSPLKDVGLIIVDECHEQSFKQDRSPRYHAVYAASTLAKLHRAKIVLGSATPGVNELYLAEQGRIKLLTLPKAIQPTHNTIEIVNHRDRSGFTRHRFIANSLITATEKALAAGEQVLIFHNRRGTAPSVLCESCGWQAICPRCTLPLTYHGDTMQLRCHSCDFTTPITHTCPVCHAPTIVFKGIGTKLIESELYKLFPKARIARFDTDNAKSEQLQARYQDLYDGKIDILVGTQIIAKGLDLPKISTVGILQADAGLHLPDFGARERTFQLLYQVSGRAGRAHKEGHVILQTYLPDHPIIEFAAHHDFDAFYTSELAYRHAAHFPPYYFLLKLVYASKTERAAIRATKQLAQQLSSTYPQFEVVGPAPAFREQLNGAFHWQIVIKSKHRPLLQTIASTLPSSWQYDLDPVSLL
ncbi:MAG TPA: primosomal protein N' [Candidatus Saccharimonadales bacterium]|nr:primosomal protein N' [Candidatus Saccharimonadales bacterium]